MFFPLCFAVLCVSLAPNADAQRLGVGRKLVRKGELSEADKQALLDVHNDYRSITALGNTGTQPMATNMVEMEWDDDLAAGASLHAAECGWEHASGSGFGENLYASSSDSETTAALTNPVTSWYNEHEEYTYSTHSCSGVCGHYTQVVWHKSTKLGCGYAICSGDWFKLYVVCRYVKPGNYVGVKPYTSTTDSALVASECPEGYTPNESTGLCSLGQGDSDEDVNSDEDEGTDEDEDTDGIDDGLFSLTTALGEFILGLLSYCS